MKTRTTSKAAALIFAFIVTVVLFQNCSNGFVAQKTENATLFSSSTPSSACQASDTRNCETSEGTGIQSCQDGGKFGACILEACKPGYYKSGNQCLPAACTPNASITCIESNGSGQKICKTDGSAYGPCVLNTCSLGFNLQNGTCVSNTCTPNSSMACSTTNGTGLRTCNAQGSAYGPCILNSCNSGYELKSGDCQGICTAGSTKSCSENNGSGLATCNSQGTGYGACQLNACNSGYRFENGACVMMACSPNQQLACNVQNGLGLMTCNSQGSAYGACLLSQCNPGFVSSNGQCISATNPTVTILPATSVRHDASRTPDYYGAYSPLGDVSGEFNFAAAAGSFFNPQISILVSAISSTGEIMPQVSYSFWMPKNVPADGQLTVPFKVVIGGSFLPRGIYRLGIQLQQTNEQYASSFYTNIITQGLPASLTYSYFGGSLIRTYYVVGEFAVTTP